MARDERTIDDQDTAGVIVARNLAGALIGGLMIASVEFATTRASVQFAVVEQLLWMLRLAVHWCLAALPVGLAIAIVELRARDGRPSPFAYVAAVAAGAAAGALLVALHSEYLDPGISVAVVGFDLPWVDRFLYGYWQLTFWGAVGAALHATDLRRRRSLAMLQSEELARLRSERRLADARLASLHAQVEPQFLLAMLGRVERLYERDPAEADRVLDALIAFLREATPLLRREASSLGEECRLLEAWLRMLDDQELAAVPAVELDAGTVRLPMPPGLLVSLAQQIVGDAPAAGLQLTVRSRRRADGTDVGLHATGCGIGAAAAGLGDALAAAAQRLELAHGPGSSIRARADGPDRLTLDIALNDHRGD